MTWRKWGDPGWGAPCPCPTIVSAPVTISIFIHQKEDPVHDLLGCEQLALLLGLHLHTAGFLQLVDGLWEGSQWYPRDPACSAPTPPPTTTHVPRHLVLSTAPQPVHLRITEPRSKLKVTCVKAVSSGFHGLISTEEFLASPTAPFPRRWCFHCERQSWHPKPLTKAQGWPNLHFSAEDMEISEYLWVCVTCMCVRQDDARHRCWAGGKSTGVSFALFPATRQHLEVKRGTDRQTWGVSSGLGWGSPRTEVCTGGPHGLSAQHRTWHERGSTTGSPASPGDELGQTTQPPRADLLFCKMDQRLPPQSEVLESKRLMRVSCRVWARALFPLAHSC